MRPRAALGLLAVGLLAATGRARGEDPPAPLEVRLYDVRALVAGAPWFIPEAVGIHPSEADETGDNHPSQAGEGELWHGSPVGSADEVVELLKKHVGPDTWDSEVSDGPAMKGTGGSRLVVRQTPEQHAAIARWLAQVERERLRSLEVEVAVVPLQASDDLPAEPAPIEALLAAAPGRLTASVAVFPGQAACTFRGRRAAYLEAGPVLGGDSSAPWASRDGVVIDGLALRVEAMPSANDDAVHVRLSVTVGTRVEGVATGPATSAVPERPALNEQHVMADMTLQPGRWTWADGRSSTGAAAGWSLAVRARRAPPVPAAEARGLSLAPFDTARRGPLETDSIPMAGLARAPYGDTIWGTPEIEPQGVPPRQPPELFSRSEALPFDAFVELLQQASTPAPWPPAWRLDEEDGLLHVLAPRAAVADLRAWLKALEQELLREIALEVRVVDVPAALDVPRVGRWPGDAESRLVASVADGSSRIRERARLVSVDGLPAGVSSGTTRTFLRGYERATHAGTQTLRPDMRPAFEGLALDVTPLPWSSGEHLSATVRLLLARLESPVRTLQTLMGPIELPASHTLRLRTTCDLAFGATTVVGACAEGDRATLVLLTARRAP